MDETQQPRRSAVPGARAPGGPVPGDAPSPVLVPVLPEGVLDEVLATLPARVSRSLDRPDVHLLLTELLAAGWKAPQVAARVAGLRIAGDVARQVRDLLVALLDEPSPRVLADRAREDRLSAARAAGLPDPPLARAPLVADPVDPRGERVPVSDEQRARWIAEVRKGLKGVPRAAAAPAPRVRPDCAICGQESTHFVTREVHLCTRCVGLLGEGRVRLAPTA
jgi:hypothetical protein